VDGTLVKPFMPRSSTKAVMPRWRDLGSVRASTTQVPATVPWVMNVFEPLSTQWSPFLTAVVRMPAASDPEPGSVSAQAASFSPVASAGSQRRFCSSLPKRRMWLVPRPLWLATVRASDPSKRATSSMTTAPARAPSAAPPYSSGTDNPRKPSSPSLRTTWWGNSSFSSQARACGFTSRSQNSRSVR